METEEKYFTFKVKTNFNSKKRFDQCGIVMYLNSENWLKASIEYENEKIQHLGSVVTNNGFSDWANCVISTKNKEMWYRFSRRCDDYCIENSEDGINFNQMRVCICLKEMEKLLLVFMLLVLKILLLMLFLVIWNLVSVFGRNIKDRNLIIK